MRGRIVLFKGEFVPIVIGIGLWFLRYISNFIEQSEYGVFDGIQIHLFNRRAANIGHNAAFQFAKSQIVLERVDLVEDRQYRLLRTRQISQHFVDSVNLFFKKGRTGICHMQEESGFFDHFERSPKCRQQGFRKIGYKTNRVR